MMLAVMHARMYTDVDRSGPIDAEVLWSSSSQVLMMMMIDMMSSSIEPDVGERPIYDVCISYDE